MYRYWKSIGVVGVALLSMAAGVEAGLVVTAEDPKVQTTSVTGATTENFDSFTTGLHTSLTTAVGTITASGPGLEIYKADQYGGVGATGNYIDIGRNGVGQSMTLTLAGPTSYFGFEWEAADDANQVEFLSNGQVVASFNPTTALGSLSSSYLGNPDTGQDSSEKFAYLNFFGTDGTTFDQVVFSNSGSSGFESDNWSILAAEVSPPYPGTSLNGATSVPEPASLVLTSMGCLGFVSQAIRRRRRLA